MNQTSDFSEACERLDSNDNWVLIVVDAYFIGDNLFRGYFETSTDESGLYMDYDPEEGALLRLGATTESGTRFFPVRTIRTDMREVMAVGITSQLLRIVTNANDRIFTYSSPEFTSLRCDSLTVGKSDDNLCPNCDVVLRFASGHGKQSLDDLLDALSNRQEYEIKRWCGSGLILVGLGMIYYVLTSRRKNSVSR